MINDGEVTLDKLKLYRPYAASHSSGTKPPCWCRVENKRRT